MKNLDETIASHREALTLRPPGHPERSSSLNELAIALANRFGLSGKVEDLEEMISFHRQALALRPPGHPNHPTSLNNLAVALYTCFQKLGRVEDLEEAISFHRSALALCPPGHPRRLNSLNNLACALCSRFNHLGRMDDLEDSILFNHNALTLCSSGHPERPMYLNNLGSGLAIRFNHLGRMEDLKDAISFYQEAVRICSSGHPDRGMSLNNLANAFRVHFTQSGKVQDLEVAISFFREALTLRPPGHPDRGGSLNNLAIALYISFTKLGKEEYLEEAISFHQKALALQPSGHPDRSMSLDNLANALGARFKHSGRVEDLENMVLFHREGLILCPPGHPNRSMCLNNLANALRIRFYHLGRLGDLEDMISFHQEALTLRPLGHPDRSTSLNNFASALHTRFNHSGRMEDLDDAISFHQEALTLRLPGHPDRSMSLNNIATALYSRFNQASRIEDLEDAISINHQAVDLDPPGHPNQSMSLNNLAQGFYTRFKQLNKMEDLDSAVLTQRKVLTFCPSGHPARSSYLRDLAEALCTQYDQLGRRQDLDESFTLFQQAANDFTSSPRHRLTAALDWVEKARHYHHRSIIHAYSTSFNLLDRCFISRPTIAIQQKMLATGIIPRFLASDAASAAIDAGELMTAVELLDQGRAILWSKMEGYRYPLDQLREVDEELADQLEMLSIELEHLALTSGYGLLANEESTFLAPAEVIMHKHRILSENWENVVAKVRKIKGFDNFLQKVPFAILKTAAAEGPIILINISKYHSDVVIVLADKDPVHLALPNIQPNHLIWLSEQLASARDESATSNNNPSKVFLSILNSLWNDIVSLVVDCLTEVGIKEKSRVWWCPTSELCGLPLHAAGLYKPQQKNLPDIYISSYISTLSALIRARSNATIENVVPKLLVIGQPGETLQNVQDEIDNIQQLGDFVDVISGANASPQYVLQKLQQHSWAHFACHGHLGNNDQPFQASFELHDGSCLTLFDLIQAKLPNAELAFLAACHSAAATAVTPDETIHLAAALQFCGFRSVVGTLWAMADKDGPIVSKEFYKYMFRKPGYKSNFRDSAEAVNQAIRALRRNRVPLERWIMFVHIGA